jgi:prophage regulatory protein
MHQDEIEPPVRAIHRPAESIATMCRELERPVRAIPRPEVQTIAALSRSGLYRAMAESGFPKPIKVGPRRVAWIHAEVVEWLNARVAERDAA